MTKIQFISLNTLNNWASKLSLRMEINEHCHFDDIWEKKSTSDRMSWIDCHKSFVQLSYFQVKTRERKRDEEKEKFFQFRNETWLRYSLNTKTISFIKIWKCFCNNEWQCYFRSISITITISMSMSISLSLVFIYAFLNHNKEIFRLQFFF